MSDSHGISFSPVVFGIAELDQALAHYREQGLGPASTSLISAEIAAAFRPIVSELERCLATVPEEVRPTVTLPAVYWLSALRELMSIYETISAEAAKGIDCP